MPTPKRRDLPPKQVALPTDEVSGDAVAVAETPVTSSANDDASDQSDTAIEGLSAEEIAEMAKLDIPAGTELACALFEDGQVRTGKVASVHSADGAVMLLLDEIGWQWPVRMDRIDLANAEWTHVDGDYPPPGVDPTFDKAHRMSELERAADAEAAEANERAAAEIMADVRAGRVDSTPTPPEMLVVEQPGGSVLATWRGPGHLAGPCVRASDGRHLEMVSAGTKGYFPARAVKVMRAQFDVHEA